ncbi:MAG: glycosyltransferase family 4 protein [Gracilibacteraceae bacterium]|jgi:glycosyltransferase involved in cell wall biosynthesis|nr:glycosyltransferase family 4 protein [Gracilibacteraceae bacterium]
MTVKACLLTSAHPPDDARIYYKEACSLRKKGYAVTLIAPRPAGISAAVPETLTAEGVRIRYAPGYRSRSERLGHLNDILRLALAEQADIYHLHDPDLIAPGLALGRRAGRPVVYDVHEYYADSLRTRYWVPAPLRGPLAVCFDWYEKQAARRLAACVTVNEDMAGLFRAANPRGVVLYNYPIASAFSFPPPAARTPPPVGEAPLLLYVGGVSRERGLEVMLEAMPLVRKRFPEAECALAGPLDEGSLNRRYRPLEPWLARGGVRSLGRVPYAEVPALLRRARVALVPLLATLNYTKAIPVKLIEYMAAGLPVVGSDFGHIRRIVAESRCGLLARPGDPADLARQICALLADPAAAAAAGQRGWEAFHASYCWEREEIKLWRLYAELVGEP